MSRRPSLVVVFTLAVSVALGASAAADPVQITSGYISVGGVQDVMSRGFLRAIQYDIVSSEFHFLGFEGDGPTQTVLAPRLPRIGYSDVLSGPDLLFLDVSPFIVTATPGPSPSPFSLTGRLRAVDQSGAVLFDDIVFGHGTATWRYVTDPWGFNVLSGAVYEFSSTAPTPEPATILLLGAGVAGLVARRRRTLPQGKC